MNTEELHNRYCGFCGNLLVRKIHPSGKIESKLELLNRKYCSRLCAGSSAPRPPSGSSHPDWKGDAALVETKRSRAQRLYDLDSCEDCGALAKDRHHRDGNPGNNARENVASLCRRCHMKTDGRLEKFVAFSKARVIQEPKPCMNCKQAYKPLRRGRCSKCSQWHRKHRTERPLR